ncbi:MAG: NYN domain-containing protein [Chromatiales bacterium]|nr:NYN domain-containing protein [Chromatiales bacterium]
MKTVWIVDGAYLFNYGKVRPTGIDYLKLKNELEKLNGGQIYEAYYLNSSPDPATDAQNAFHTWIKSAPPKGPKMRVQLYKLKDIHNKCPSCGCQFDRQVQKGVDVGVATLIIKLASQNVYDRLILSAGDGDFEDAISYVKSDLHKEFWVNGAQASLLLICNPIQIKSFGLMT